MFPAAVFAETRQDRATVLHLLRMRPCAIVPDRIRATGAGDMSDEYLSEVQFCERYGVGQRTAQRWRATGGGPPYARLGKWRIAYRVSDCERWAAGRTYLHRAGELAGKPVCAAARRAGA